MNELLFRSSTSFTTLDKYSKVIIDLPPLMPSQEEYENVKTTVTAIKESAQNLFIFAIIFQVFMSATKSLLWSMYNTLQLLSLEP